MTLKPLLAISTAALIGACSMLSPSTKAPPPPLPSLPISQTNSAPSLTVMNDLQSGQRSVTLSAVNTNAGDLLGLLAEAANASIIIAPEIASRKVSVYLQNVPAATALAKVVEIVTGSTAGTVPAVAALKPVFYDLPVNINTASAEAILLRFRTSAALADWIVAARLK